MAKLYKNRVMVEIMMDIYTEGDTEEEAGAKSEDVADNIVRFLEDQLALEPDWHPGYKEDCQVYLSTWGVRNTDVEEYKEEQ